MHPRLAEIADQLERTRRDLLAAVPARFAPSDLARRPAAGAWSIAEIFDHLAAVEASVARLIEKTLTRAGAAGLPRETSIESVASCLDGTLVRDRSHPLPAPEIVLPRPGVSIAEARSSMETAREALRAAMARADGYDLGTVSVQHPLLGPLTLYQWLVMVVHHEARHTEQVAEVAATHVTGEHRAVASS